MLVAEINSAVLVGPCPWEPPIQPPLWLEQIDRRIVLITTSSEFRDDARLAACALQALATEDLHVVATHPARIRSG
jgi:UDP:flavonoid glycosyltransferase YjiC (YdhE family)